MIAERAADLILFGDTTIGNEQTNADISYSRYDPDIQDVQRLNVTLSYPNKAFYNLHLGK